MKYAKIISNSISSNLGKQPKSIENFKQRQNDKANTNTIEKQQSVGKTRKMKKTARRQIAFWSERKQ